MRFYKVHVWSEVDGSQGFEWTTSKRAAEAAARDSDDTTVTVVNVEPTRAGILALLKEHAAHADNG